MQKQKTAKQNKKIYNNEIGYSLHLYHFYQHANFSTSFRVAREDYFVKTA